MSGFQLCRHESKTTTTICGRTLPAHPQPPQSTAGERHPPRQIYEPGCSHPARGCPRGRYSQVGEDGVVFTNTLYALLGAVFGILLGALPRGYSGLRRWRLRVTVARRRALATSGAIDRWLLDYYDGYACSLFYSEINGHVRYVPVLYDRSLVFPRVLDPVSDWPLQVEPERLNPFSVDQALLDKRRKMGAILFQSWRKSMYLDSISFEPRPEMVVIVRPCEYFEIATALIGLEEETYRSVHRDTRRYRLGRTKNPLRDEHRRNLPVQGGRQLRPLSVGSNTVLAIKAGCDYQIAIQTRAETVITSPNTKAVIPNYGFEPNMFAGRKSSYGVVYYNFIREYLEELFDYDEIIGRSKWAQNPDWLLRLPEARTLLHAIRTGRFTLVYLGAGIECLSGTTTLALLAIIEDQSVIDELMQRLSPNYEVVTPTTTLVPVEFLSIADPRLGIWHERGKYQASTAFALALALRYLRQNSSER
jgi:hypothetical protein